MEDNKIGLLNVSLTCSSFESLIPPMILNAGGWPVDGLKEKDSRLNSSFPKT